MRYKLDPLSQTGISTIIEPKVVQQSNGYVVDSRVVDFTLDTIHILKSGDTLADASNFALGTDTGTKIGTATTQKLGFFNATPVVQQGATTDLGVVLSALGLRASGTAYPLTTSGAIAFSGAVALTGSFRSGSASLTTGTTLTTSSVEYQMCNATTAAFNVTLPSTTTAGYRFTIKKTDNSANAVTVVGTVDGATNYSLAAQYKYVTVISTTTSGVWYVVGNN